MIKLDLDQYESYTVQAPDYLQVKFLPHNSSVQVSPLQEFRRLKVGKTYTRLDPDYPTYKGSDVRIKYFFTKDSSDEMYYWTEEGTWARVDYALRTWNV